MNRVGAVVLGCLIVAGLGAWGILELTEDHADTVKDRARALERQTTRRLHAIADAVPDLREALPTVVRSPAKTYNVVCRNEYFPFESTGSESVGPEVRIEFRSTGPIPDALRVVNEELQAAGFVVATAHPSDSTLYELKRAMKGWWEWVTLAPSGPDTFTLTGSISPDSCP